MKSEKLFYSALFLLVMALSFVFYDALANLALRWSEREEYSHGFFIPMISAWLLWQRKDALAATTAYVSLKPLVLLFFAVFLFLVGELSAIYILMHLSFVLMLIALVWLFAGFDILKLSFVPLIYLLFAIPTPYFIDAQLTWGLQLVSSDLGAKILRLLDVSVYVEGNVIDLGDLKLNVVEACSGLNYLYPLLSLGFLMAYMYQGHWWQRVIVLVSTVPITVFMNSFRIAMIGVSVNLYGREMAEGALHFFEGWIVFMSCAVLLTLEIWLLDRFTGKRRFTELFGVPVVKPIINSNRQAGYSFKKANSILLGLLLLVGAVALLLIENDGRTEQTPDRKLFTSFPTRVGQWSGYETAMSDNVESALKLDDYIKSTFRKYNQNIDFYVAYYASQRKGASPHSPRVCIPGGGWRITDLQEIMLEHNGQRFPVNRFVIELNDVRRLGYYWFEARGRRVANEYLMKWYLLLDSVFKNRTDGALVRITTGINSDEELRDAEQRLAEFTQEVVLSNLNEYVPE